MCRVVCKATTSVTERGRPTSKEVLIIDRFRYYWMVFKSFKVVTFEQILGFEDGDSDGKNVFNLKSFGQTMLKV